MLASWITKDHRDRVSDDQTSCQEGPKAAWAESVAWYGKLMTTGRT